MIKSIINMVSIGVVTLFLGCNDTEHSDDINYSVKIIKKIELNGNITKEPTQEYNEEKSEIRGKLNDLLYDIAKEENKNYDIKRELEDMVAQTDTSISDNVKKDLQDFVGSFDNLGELSEEEERLGHVDMEDVIDVKNELERLVEGTDEIKREQIESKFKMLVEDTLKSEETLKQTKKTLIQLVDASEKNGSKEAEQFANSIIEDVSSRKIVILDAKDEYITIKVKQGDNLSSLAKKYYGNPNKHQIIYNANRNIINEDKIIFPGTTLIIPKI